MNGMSFWRNVRCLAVAVALAVLSAGCFSSLYDDPGNWVVEDSDLPEFFAEYDVFYLYSSRQKDYGEKYLNWLAEGVSDELRREVTLPLNQQFGQRVRVFSPFVPELSHSHYLELLSSAESQSWEVDWTKTSLDAAIEYTVKALKHYWKRKGKSHPVILLGHGQGALVLYEAMKRCPDVTPENGFVAAYLFGIPNITPERIRQDFGSRGITVAADKDNAGVIAICNLHTPATPFAKTFALRGGAVINPINWRTDKTPALPKQHAGAVFYNMNEQNPNRRIKMRPAFCGAVLDTENALVNVTHLPSDSRNMVIDRDFGAHLHGVFGLCISRNARDRVRMYKFRIKGVKHPGDD